MNKILSLISKGENQTVEFKTSFQNKQIRFFKWYEIVGNSASSDYDVNE